MGDQGSLDLSLRGRVKPGIRKGTTPKVGCGLVSVARRPKKRKQEKAKADEEKPVVYSWQKRADLK